MTMMMIIMIPEVLAARGKSYSLQCCKSSAGKHFSGYKMLRRWQRFLDRKVNVLEIEQGSLAFYSLFEEEKRVKWRRPQVFNNMEKRVYMLNKK